MNGVLLGVVSAILIGLSNFTGGLASRKDASLTVGFVGQAITVPVVAAALIVAPASHLSTGDLVAGAIAGLCQILGVRLLWQALSAGAMGLLNAISALAAASVPAVWAVVRGERMGPVAWLGVGLAASAVVLVARSPGDEQLLAGRHRRQVYEAAGAGALFGLGFVGLALPSRTASVAPLLSMRCVAALIGAFMIMRTSKPLWLGAGNRRVGLLPGLFGGASLLVFLAAVHLKLTAVVSIVQGLSPLATATLAFLILGQRLRHIQLSGLGLALVATLLIARG